MTIRSMCGSAGEVTECQFVDLKNKVWTFQRFQVAFRSSADAEMADAAGSFKGENCRFMMCLKGKLRICEPGPYEKGEFFLDTGNCCLQYHPGHCPCLDCGHHHRAQVLELLCPPADLLPLVYGTRVGLELERALNERRPLCIHQSMSPCIRRIFDSLKEVAAKNDGAFASLVLARTLEAVWCFTRAWDSMSLIPVSLEVRQAVQKACSILESSMANPPTLETLAAETGMSLSKLKQVFSRVCGVPPYAYLRRVRMERAMELLVEKKMNVTETALEVGYSSMSHFAKAFTAHYGIKPSRVTSEKEIFPSDKSAFDRKFFGSKS